MAEPGPNLMEALLDEFRSLFTEPQELSPQRLLDHRIHLLPDTTPVAVITLIDTHTQLEG